MKIGDKVEVINPKRGHFGLTGKIVSRTLLEFAVAISTRAGRHLGGGMYEPGELKLIEEGQNVTATITEQEFLALTPAEQSAMVGELIMGECRHEWHPTGPNAWDHGCAVCGARDTTFARRIMHAVGQSTPYVAEMGAAWLTVLQMRSEGYTLEMMAYAARPPHVPEPLTTAEFHHPERQATGRNTRAEASLAVGFAALKAKGAIT